MSKRAPGRVAASWLTGAAVVLLATLCVAVPAALAAAPQGVDAPVMSSSRSDGGPAAGAYFGYIAPGDLLNVTTGTWDNGPTSFSYQWERCHPDGNVFDCTAIPGATSRSYTISTDDLGARLEADVTASNADGDNGASAYTADLVGEPEVPYNSLPLLTDERGGPVDGFQFVDAGDTLQAPPASDWLGNPTFSYQWERCMSDSCSEIGSATAATYTVASADRGYSLRLTVVASNAFGSWPEEPWYSRGGDIELWGGAGGEPIVGAPAPGADLPGLTNNSGTFEVVEPGDVLSVSTGDVLGDALTVSDTWKRCTFPPQSAVCTPIDDAVGASYTVTTADLGHVVEPVVTATNAYGRLVWPDAGLQLYPQFLHTDSGGQYCQGGSYAVVGVPALACGGDPTITSDRGDVSTVIPGELLTASHGAWSGSPTSYAYEWKSCHEFDCSDVGAESVYSVSSSDVGRYLEVAITASAAGGSTTASTSQSVYVDVAPPPPAITGFSPSTGAPGTTVTIHGANFTNATTVGFGGTPAASFEVNSDSQITAIVSSSTRSGRVTVTTLGGTAASTRVFMVPPPRLRAITPMRAPVGSTVRIVGEYLGDATAVRFNGTPATFAAVSATVLTAVVPDGATSGRIVVTTPGGTATSPATFAVVPLGAPWLASFAPTSGVAGSHVTLHGRGFTGTSAVAFAGTAASYDVIGDSTIIAVIPTAATTGRITVTAPGGIATSASVFAVRQRRP